VSVPPNDLDQEWQRPQALAERPAASTGGDGAHFGMLHHPGTTPQAAPIVMTVPMAFSDPNHVAGASLREFLEPWPRVGERLAELRARYLPRPAPARRAVGGPRAKATTARLMSVL
jgi:hypothetical protein